ncbi:MAG TPA: phosphoribosylanthranilate isomerase [Candidatus Marinimicrobia bacterium]|nr:phosphoribosylanthranilate isomerase [Candidatus Neomarinimicrobiota bacterium]
MNIPVKICGITSLKDAKIAVNYGASAIGLIFFQGSPRYVDPGKVKNWILDIPKNVKKVGVFVNEKIENIHSIVRGLNLDFIQLHGHESPDYCDQMIKPVIKVFRVGDDFDSNVLKDYQVAAFLFDTYQKGRPGGTGENFNWDLIADLKTNVPIILSGGLNAGNILDGIKAVNPSAVDINSGVESIPGIKDGWKVKNIFSKLENTKGHGELF